MADERQVVAALTEFTQTLVKQYAIADVLAELTERLVPTLALAGAGVSVGDERGLLRFVTATGDSLTEVERMQETAQQGPCVDCFRTSSVVVAPDLVDETRWERYRPVAIEHGLRAAAALPLRAGDGCIGSLNLYSAERRSWTDEDLGAAALFADMASTYVSSASDLQRSERIREQLQQALESRVVIEQAKGIIAGKHAISVDEAYHVLRRYTRSHNAELHAVSHAVVHLGLDLKT